MGDPHEWGQSCNWAPKCKKKTFFSNRNILGAKWLQKWVLNRWLLPIFEQVTPSRSSGKNEEARGKICPHPTQVLKGPKSAGFYGVKLHRAKKHKRAESSVFVQKKLKCRTIMSSEGIWLDNYFICPLLYIVIMSLAGQYSFSVS